MASSPTDILHFAYDQATQISVTLSTLQQASITTLVQYAESQKGVLTALITSLVKKIETPTQDVRYHKVELPNGYSGRSYDTRYITPFLREHFPRLAMAESGWLTRSIEQAHPFTLDFPGKIANTQVKLAFLEILQDIETNDADPQAYLVALLAGLLAAEFERKAIEYYATDAILTVEQVMHLLREHFYFDYHVSGGARLPVLAVYAAYELLMSALPRYQEKQLLPLKRHSTPDNTSGSIGDIEVINLSDHEFFEAIEIKHNKPISAAMVNLAIGKIRDLPVKRYLLLTTAEPNTNDLHSITPLIAQMLASHGCEIIINGVMPTLKYYLRLLETPQQFVMCYEKHLLGDYDLKRIHIEHWQTLKAQL